MIKIFNFILSFIKNLFKTNHAPQKKRAQRVKSLWPQIKKNVEMWESAMRDTRIDRFHVRRGDNPKYILKIIKEGIPAWGAYCCSDEWETYKDWVDSTHIDCREFYPGSAHIALIGKSDVCGPHDNMLEYGVNIITLIKTSELWDKTYSMHPGQLYEISHSHWTRNYGHVILHGQIVICDNGDVYPTYGMVTNEKKTRSKHGFNYIPSRSWQATTPNNLKDLAVWLNFCLERNAYWNCTVRSNGIPPLAFPVKEHDIVRVFPRYQRDGYGKIVHWTRVHKRKTKRGETFVRAHIRGNTEWAIDGRTINITMPGKHHGCLTENETVLVPDNDLSKCELIKDRITGLYYTGAGKSIIHKLINRGRVTNEEIEIKAA